MMQMFRVLRHKFVDVSSLNVISRNRVDAIYVLVDFRNIVIITSSGIILQKAVCWLARLLSFRRPLSGVHTAHDIGRHRPVSLSRPMSQGIQRCRTMSCAVWTPLYC